MEGILLLIFALVLAAMTGVFKKVPNAKTVTGEIVSVERGNHQGERGTPSYYAWVDYDVNGTMYSMRSSYRSSSFYTGKKVQIVYNSDNPEEAIIKPSVGTYIWLAVLVIGAIFLFVYGFLNK